MTRAEAGFLNDEKGTAQDYLGRYGPTLWIDIGFDPKYKAGQPGVPESQIQNVPALVDTGAGESMIDDKLAADLKLPLVDRVIVAGIGGTHEINVYLAHLYIPSLGYIQYGRFGGGNLAEGGQEHKALLGRSLLRDMLMVFDGPKGQVALAF